jgi:hypothetical protein
VSWHRPIASGGLLATNATNSWQRIFPVLVAIRHDAAVDQRRDAARIARLVWPEHFHPCTSDSTCPCHTLPPLPSLEHLSPPLPVEQLPLRTWLDNHRHDAHDPVHSASSAATPAEEEKAEGEAGDEAGDEAEENAADDSSVPPAPILILGAPPAPPATRHTTHPPRPPQENR